MGILLDDRQKLQSDARRIADCLAAHEALDEVDLSTFTDLANGELAAALWHLRKNDIVNRIGASKKYQLSMRGRKLLGISVPTPIKPASPPTVQHSQHELGPGPRGQLVAALKHRPQSISALARRTGLKYHQVVYFLRTLEERALLARHDHPTDRRVVLYSLKSFLLEPEPPKPVLTPSLVPLADPADWRTWAEKLLIAKCGGPAVAIDEDERLATPIAPIVKANKKRILILGYHDAYQRGGLQRKFGDRCKFYFFWHRERNLRLSNLCRLADVIVLRVDNCRHADQDAARSSGTPIRWVSGGFARVCALIEGVLCE